MTFALCVFSVTTAMAQRTPYHTIKVAEKATDNREKGAEMSIFGNFFGNKGKVTEEPVCDCGGACDSTPPENNDAIIVKVMGTGCKKCHQLHENTLAAAEYVGKAVKVEYVTDIAEIAVAGVMSTPALLVDNKVVSTGKVLSTEEVEDLLR